MFSYGVTVIQDIFDKYRSYSNDKNENFVQLIPKENF